MHFLTLVWMKLFIPKKKNSNLQIKFHAELRKSTVLFLKKLA